MVVTAVIPLFNKQDTISRAAQSCAHQRGLDGGIIVVDDGSTDRSVAVLKELGLDEVRIVLQENAGPGAARNTGVRHASSTFVAFLDADDEWRPGFLEAAVAALRQYPEAIGYVCGYDSGEYRAQRPNKVRELNKPRGAVPPPYDADGETLKKHVDALHSSCIVVRKSRFEDAGGFYSDNGCRYGEDSWIWSRLLLSGPFIWDEKEFVRFHVEDSELGFAVTSRRSARPITLESDQWHSYLPTAAKDAGERLSKYYAQLDYNILMRSLSWRQARRVRRRHELKRRLGWLKEVWACLRAARERMIR